MSQATQKTRIGSAASKKSSMSRAGSAISKKSNLTRAGSGKSQKSVVWSTSGISDVGSEFGLLDDDEEIKEKKKNCCSGIISGTVQTKLYYRLSKNYNDHTLLYEYRSNSIEVFCI